MFTFLLLKVIHGHREVVNELREVLRRGDNHFKIVVYFLKLIMFFTFSNFLSFLFFYSLVTSMTWSWDNHFESLRGGIFLYLLPIYDILALKGIDDIQYFTLYYMLLGVLHMLLLMLFVRMDSIGIFFFGYLYQCHFSLYSS